MEPKSSIVIPYTINIGWMRYLNLNNICMYCSQRIFYVSLTKCSVVPMREFQGGGCFFVFKSNHILFQVNLFIPSLSSPKNWWYATSCGKCISNLWSPQSNIQYWLNGLYVVGTAGGRIGGWFMLELNRVIYSCFERNILWSYRLPRYR